MKLPLVNCVHADAEPARPITCAIGCYGGHPSPLSCSACAVRVPRHDGPALTWVHFPDPEPPPPPPPFDYASEWAALHRRALAFAGDAAEERKYLDELGARLPCGSCGGDFAMLRRTMPPDLSSADAYFAWTVWLHNQVNLKIGKPVLSVEDARRHWSEAITAARA